MIRYLFTFNTQGFFYWETYDSAVLCLSYSTQHLRFPSPTKKEAFQKLMEILTPEDQNKFLEFVLNAK